MLGLYCCCLICIAHKGVFIWFISPHLICCLNWPHFVLCAFCVLWLVAATANWVASQRRPTLPCFDHSQLKRGQLKWGQMRWYEWYEHSIRETTSHNLGVLRVCICIFICCCLFVIISFGTDVCMYVSHILRRGPSSG